MHNCQAAVKRTLTVKNKHKQWNKSTATRTWLIIYVFELNPGALSQCYPDLPSMHATYPPCSKNVWIHSLLFRSQSFMVLSSLPDTISLPSGDHLAHLTQFMCWLNENWNFWRWTVQTWRWWYFTKWAFSLKQQHAQCNTNTLLYLAMNIS